MQWNSWWCDTRDIVQPEILLLVTLDSHPFADHQVRAQGHQRKMSKYASAPRASLCVPNCQKRRKCNVETLFLKPCPLFYWEFKSQECDFPNICSGTRRGWPACLWVLALPKAPHAWEDRLAPKLKWIKWRADYSRFREGSDMGGDRCQVRSEATYICPLALWL